MSVINVPKEALIVETRGGTFLLGTADEKDERTISMDGEPLEGSDRWGVTRLEAGSRMIFYPAGCYEPDDAQVSVSPVVSIRSI